MQTERDLGNILVKWPKKVEMSPCSVNNMLVTATEQWVFLFYLPAHCTESHIPRRSAIP